MADVSKVTASDGTTYDIKDSTARSGLSDKMDKANPTGTGSLSLNRRSDTTVGTESVAIGSFVTASGNYSHAEGRITVASGQAAHSEGISTNSTGGGSHAEGSNTRASADYSHAEGYSTRSSGSSSHAEGGNTKASGDYSHAEGYGTTASSNYSHAEGICTEANTNRGAHAEGYGKYNDDEDFMLKIVASGKGAHAEGSYNDTSGSNTVGPAASGQGSHSEGFGANVASGKGAHAEGGLGSTASGNYSHAEGQATTASEDYSHAEGYSTTASGGASHAEGYYTTASGSGAHAEGYYTKATGMYQHVSGRYNIEDNTCAEIIGNGTADAARSNARTLDWEGNEWIAGGFECNGMKASSSSVTLINPQKWRDAIFDATPDGSAKDRVLSRLYKEGANIRVLEYGGYFGGSQNKRLKITCPEVSYGKFLIFVHLEADTTVHDYEIFGVLNAQGTAYSKAHYGRTTPSWTNITGTASTGNLTWGVTGTQIYSSVFAPYGSWYVKIIMSIGDSNNAIPNVYMTNES